MKKSTRSNDKFGHHVFDIETIGQSEEVIRSFMPKEISEPVMPADLENGTPPDDRHQILEKSVEKYRAEGGRQFEEAVAKYDAWKAEKANAWRLAKQDKIAKWNRERMDKELSFIEKACLNAETATIPLTCCVDPSGLIHIFVIASQKDVSMTQLAARNPFKLYEAKTEEEMISKFWRYALHVSDAGINARFTGWNSNKFDLPMLWRRSKILNIPIPVPTMVGRYPDNGLWVDMMEAWQCGDRQLYVGVNQIAKALGCKARKSGDGRNFHVLWKRDKTEAILYCMDDVICEKEICQRIMQ